MALRTKEQIAEGKQAFLNMGLGAFVNALCYFICAWVALLYYDPYDATLSTITVIAGAIAGPLIMLIFWGKINAGFASFLSVVSILIFPFAVSIFQYNGYEMWFKFATGGLIIGTIWCLLLYVTSAIPVNKNGCTTCNAEGNLKQSPKFLDASYTGTCYVCLGKKKVTNIHPHYQAVKILEKYVTDITQTKIEHKELLSTYREMKKQKQQGPEALGDTLYQQTIELEQKYYDQVELRLKQIAFFEQGLRKLHRMMYNSMMAENMLQKQKDLSAMFDDNANDLGSIMSLKAQLEMHTDVIDRINSLSIQVDMHSSTSIANDLAKEIEEM